MNPAPLQSKHHRANPKINSKYLDLHDTRLNSQSYKDDGADRLPHNGFRYYLTLFSKFFSTFPRGTCSLSVFRRYLALGEVYHPIRVVLTNNSTLRSDPKVVNLPPLNDIRDYHPLWYPFPRDFYRRRRPTKAGRHPTFR